MPASGGFKAAPVEMEPNTFKSTVLFVMVIVVGIFNTPIENIASFAASYLSVPLNETVMVAIPWPTATNESSTILTTETSLEV